MSEIPKGGGGGGLGLNFTWMGVLKSEGHGSFFSLNPNCRIK